MNLSSGGSWSWPITDWWVGFQSTIWVFYLFCMGAYSKMNTDRGDYFWEQGARESKNITWQNQKWLLDPRTRNDLGSLTPWEWVYVSKMDLENSFCSKESWYMILESKYIRSGNIFSLHLKGELHNSSKGFTRWSTSLCWGHM